MRTVPMMWLMFCNSARNNCFISWAPLRAVIDIVIAAVIALAVDDRAKMNVCTNPRLLILPCVWLRKDRQRCVAVNGLDLFKWHLEVPRIFPIRQF